MKCHAAHSEAGILFRRPLTLQSKAKQSKVKRSGRSQNRMHAQKALMDYLLLGKLGEVAEPPRAKKEFSDCLRGLADAGLIKKYRGAPDPTRDNS